MKKTIIPFSILAIFAGLLPQITHAQTAVTVYGWVDIGYVGETGKDWRMDENDSNAFGIKGTEDLGGGNKATFDIQTRFTLQNGELESSEGVEWEGASNMGLAGHWGSLRFGRMNEVPTETFRVLDPLNQDGAASMLRSSQRSVRIGNTVRYDSPVWNGLYLRASYSLGEDGHHAEPGSASKAGADNDGYAASLRYDRGPLFLLGSWSRRADSNDSYMWNLGGAYAFGPVRFSLGYERTRDKGWKNGGYSNHALAAQYGGTEGITSRQDSWIAGLKWTVGQGTVDAFFNYVRLKDADVAGTSASLSDDSARKYGLGYTYNLSKRTQVYTRVSYIDFGSGSMAAYYRGTGLDNENVTTFQLGMFHKF
ncbi:porin [Oxalobacter vibrioformis]|uniref:Porin n=1 Tax=Oxalobacter vibrioformis TaxID=933080 RepID=A0A9E9P2U1_9BURK|nr:porin [Oxalobacter vibrioformis]WAW09570.1 porin [Oxalobacter vibrioformis]